MLKFARNITCVGFPLVLVAHREATSFFTRLTFFLARKKLGEVLLMVSVANDSLEFLVEALESKHVHIKHKHVRRKNELTLSIK